MAFLFLIEHFADGYIIKSYTWLIFLVNKIKNYDYGFFGDVTNTGREDGEMAERSEGEIPRFSERLWFSAPGA